jgi:hypothetical protein
MKKNEVKIGRIYYATVTGKKVQVQIDEEKSGGGWSATNLFTGKKITIKTAGRLQGLVPKGKQRNGQAKVTTEGNVTVVEVPKAKSETITNKKNAPTPKPDGKMSCIAAAFQVLTESGEPMNAKEMIEAMENKGYWQSPGGKTPHATLYSAILRDISKGDESRFEKVERGRFIARR